jgi:hypothetical protein
MSFRPLPNQRMKLSWRGGRLEGRGGTAPQGRPPFRWDLACLSAALGLLHPVAAHAQIEIAPYAGTYRPTSILGSGAGVTLKQQPSIALGVRVTHWWPDHLGIEGTLGYAPSPLKGTQDPSPVTAHVLTASAQGLLRVTSAMARVGLSLGGGVGLVTHGGFAYPPWYVGPVTFLGGIANVGASIRLTKRVAVRLDAEDFIYSAHVGRCTRSGAPGGGACDIWNAGELGSVGGGFKVTPTASVVQNDLVLSVALTVILDRTRLGTGSVE